MSQVQLTAQSKQAVFPDPGPAEQREAKISPLRTGSGGVTLGDTL